MSNAPSDIAIMTVDELTAELTRNALRNYSIRAELDRRSSPTKAESARPTQEDYCAEASEDYD